MSYFNEQRSPDINEAQKAKAQKAKAQTRLIQSSKFCMWDMDGLEEDNKPTHKIAIPAYSGSTKQSSAPVPVTGSSRSSAPTRSPTLFDNWGGGTAVSIPMTPGYEPPLDDTAPAMGSPCSWDDTDPITREQLPPRSRWPNNGV